MLSTKENLHNWPVWCQRGTNLLLSPGVWRETLSTLTPPWPPPCWGLRPASSWYPQWTITIVGSTPVELRTQLGCPLTQLNSKSMVKYRDALKYFIYRTSWDHSIFIWKRSCQPRGVYTVDLCGIQGWQTSDNHLESEGRHCVIWPLPDHHHAGHSSQHAGHIICGLSTQWSLYMQSRKFCRHI